MRGRPAVRRDAASLLPWRPRECLAVNLVIALCSFNEDPGEEKKGKGNRNVIKVYEDHQILFKLNRKRICIFYLYIKRVNKSVDKVQLQSYVLFVKRVAKRLEMQPRLKKQKANRRQRTP